MISFIAAIAAILAGTFFGLRAQMLKPVLSSWPDAPQCVHLATFGLSAVLGSYAVAVVNGYQSTIAEALILLALATYSGLLWLNLYRQVVARGPQP